MPLTQAAYPPFLGNFTLAGLFSAYAHGGAALAALIPGSYARLIDATYGYNFRVRPNSAGTYWSVEAPQIILFDTTPQTGANSTSNQVLKTGMVPAGMLRMCRKFIVRLVTGKNGTVDTSTGNSLRCGTTGTISDASMRTITTWVAANRAMPTWVETIVTSATQFTVHGGSASSAGWPGTATGTPAQSTFTCPDVDANNIYFSPAVQMAGTTDAPQAFSLEIELIP